MSEVFISEDEMAEPTIDRRLFRVTNKKIRDDRFHLDLDELSNNVQQRDLLL